jgi:hypothetical protein
LDTKGAGSMIRPFFLSVIPGRCEASNLRGCNCTPGNLEIPGLVLRTIPE